VCCTCMVSEVSLTSYSWLCPVLAIPHTTSTLAATKAGGRVADVERVYVSEKTSGKIPC
jgi:hypothetical protein